MTTIKNNTFTANQFADKVAENISSYTLTEENEPCTVYMQIDDKCNESYGDGISISKAYASNLSNLSNSIKNISDSLAENDYNISNKIRS